MNSITIGMDLGDKNNLIFVLDDAGNVLKTSVITNNKKSIVKFFTHYAGATVAIEAGTHSPWISRVLEQLGCEVLVGNPRKLRMIWGSNNKNDMRDAEMLARIARFDRHLLHPIKHRGEQTQADLCLIKARDMLVQNRTSLVNHVRGAVKSIGMRIPKCSAECFHKKAPDHIPGILKEALLPVVEMIENLTRRIKDYTRQAERINEEKYPETRCLLQVKGVGTITALAYVLTLEERARFEKSRDVGPFIGLTPKQDQSGTIDKQLRITKAGNQYLRRLLVGCAHYILGPFGEDCDLRRFGLRLTARGGKNAKRRAVVAVARKLAVLLHRLWVTGEVYEPFYKSRVKRLTSEIQEGLCRVAC